MNLDRPPPTQTWDELRSMFGVDDTELRRWVRYGCPFVEAGPLDSTTGWSFRSSHVFRWLALFTSYLEVQGRLTDWTQNSR